jgi:hypothetical protein
VVPYSDQVWEEWIVQQNVANPDGTIQETGGREVQPRPDDLPAPWEK